MVTLPLNFFNNERVIPGQRIKSRAKNLGKQKAFDIASKLPNTALDIERGKRIIRERPGRALAARLDRVNSELSNPLQQPGLQDISVADFAESVRGDPFRNNRISEFIAEKKRDNRAANRLFGLEQERSQLNTQLSDFLSNNPGVVPGLRPEGGALGEQKLRFENFINPDSGSTELFGLDSLGNRVTKSLGITKTPPQRPTVSGSIPSRAQRSFIASLLKDNEMFSQLTEEEQDQFAGLLTDEVNRQLKSGAEIQQAVAKAFRKLSQTMIDPKGRENGFFTKLFGDDFGPALRSIPDLGIELTPPGQGAPKQRSQPTAQDFLNANQPLSFSDIVPGQRNEQSIDVEQAIRDAKSAIRNGKDPELVKRRLQEHGIQADL